jgi:hypothetical protein
LKKIAALVLVGIFALGLTGCSKWDNNEGYKDKGWSSQNIATPNGTVTCVLFDGYDGDSISCDWNSASTNKDK